MRAREIPSRAKTRIAARSISCSRRLLRSCLRSPPSSECLLAMKEREGFPALGIVLSRDLGVVGVTVHGVCVSQPGQTRQLCFSKDTSPIR